MKESRVTKDTEPKTAGSDKKQYRKPQLIHYGSLRELTTGGSGNANETSCAPDEPGCNPDDNKRKPL
jgi:hypothetical protein